jgi:hypothetical protein
VTVTLASSGAARWHSWTSRYNTAGNSTVDPRQIGSTPPCGAYAAIACSDFVAFIVGDDAFSVPVTLAALGRVTQISGTFDEAAATKLAHQIAP